MNIQKIHRDELPRGLREALRDLRYSLATPGVAAPQVFSNNEGFLPPAGRGNTYYEHDVGQDRTGGRGRFRLVALMSDGGSLEALYFTSAHYGGEWTQICW